MFFDVVFHLVTKPVCFLRKLIPKVRDFTYALKVEDVLVSRGQ